MGINIHVYTVYGIRLSWIAELNTAYEKIEEDLCSEFGYGKPTPADRQIDAVFDWMSCDYMILGKILYDSGDFRYCKDMNYYQEFDISSLEEYKNQYLVKFQKLYPSFYPVIADKEWKLINVIHYS